MSRTPAWQGVVASFGDRMSIEGKDRPVTLLEGATPLIPAHRLVEALGGGFELHLKYEGLNPTGSFKDRGMTAALTEAVSWGRQAVICASTGNTAASAAAYAARAGIKCMVLIPEGKIALGKLAGALAYGAQVIAVRGSFDDALDMVREAEKLLPVALVNSINPARIEGQKTAAFEIVDALGEAPDWLCLPVGNAGNITSYWRGFKEDYRIARTSKLPRLLGVQAAGAAPIVTGQRVHHPETMATAIRIGNPARWQDANEALIESLGSILAVSDEEILDAYRLVVRTEGVFCEPSSAAGIAGLRKLLREGGVSVRGKTVVAVLTGHGLKDPNAALGQAVEPKVIEADVAALMEVVEA